MDVAWALDELGAFVELATLVQPPPVPGIVDFTDNRHPHGSQEALVAASHVVEQVLDRVIPDWRSTTPPNKRHRWDQMRDASVRAIAQLQRQAELLEKLGDGSPQVSLSGLHSWVWDAARSFWAQGSFRVAVREAASSLNAHTQAKLNRYDVADDALFGEAFGGGDPAPGRPRLRLPNPIGSKTQESRQRGARDLAQGCFWALRNPATHEVDEWEQQMALEALCALSLLARLIDECAVHTAP